ncbi:MAG TPA: radical SAM protein [Planctomycetota bacterium]|jgi:radical SAM protein with 4Fe4S-binding SPASM domain
MTNTPVTSRLAPSFLPTTAVLEMTYRCNHACLFCSCPWYAPESRFDVRPEMSVAEWQALIARLCEMGVNNFAFTGGEPLLKDRLDEIIEFAAARETEFIETKDGALVSRRGPPKLYLLSNGKALHDGVVALCKKHAINLSISLPGLTTFSEHTAGGDPQNVLHWFKKAHDSGVTTTVGVTVTRRNLHELYETIAEALLAGADTLLMNRFLPGGRGLKHAADLSISIPQIKEMLDTAEQILETANRYGSVGTELPKCIVDETRYKRLSVGTRCSAALSFFVVDPSGYVRVCNHSTVRLQHVRELDRVKDDPYWRRFTQKDYLPQQCSGCRAIAGCDGGCREAAHIVGGALDSPDPVLPPAWPKL